MLVYSSKDCLVDIIPVVLCGGSGTRLWPLSRRDFPKQFHAMLGEHTLFQQALLRARLLSDHPPVVVTADAYRFLVKDQAAALGVPLHAVLLEPEAKNTAPAIAMAAMVALEHSPSARLFVMSADHYFGSMQPFERMRSLLPKLSLDDYLVTFGIAPKHASTDYGYIQVGQALSHGLHQVAAFIEKPALQQAQAYVQSVDYLWNSGMFAFGAALFLSELKQYQPQIYDHCKEAWQQHTMQFDCIQWSATVWASCPADSIDYAVMEHSKHVAVLPLSVAWSDVGSWPGLQQVLPADANGNAVTGDVSLHESRGNLVFAKHRMVTTVGVSDHVVVETADAVLVMHRDHASHMKDCVHGMLQEGREQVLHHSLVHRPWGSYEVLTELPGYKVKHIVVKPGESLSLQRHKRRSEHWVVVRGQADVVVAERSYLLSAGESIDIPVATLHQLSNQSDENIELIEVQLGAYLGEDDIERLHDRYGRVAIDEPCKEDVA
jgi:mannose-1-phosphate guanylyltransferase/mannose-6-phosphate isomerase